MRGRLQKPRYMKVLTEKDVKDGPVTEILKDFSCPDWMPELGYKLWAKLAPSLIKAKVLTELDKSSFEALCLSYALMRQAGLQLINKGFTVKSERGSVKKHPIFSIYKSNAELYLRYSELFGLSPRSREFLSIVVDDQTEESSLIKPKPKISLRKETL